MKNLKHLIVIILCLSAIGLTGAQLPVPQDDWKSEIVPIAINTKKSVKGRIAFWGSLDTAMKYGDKYQEQHLIEKLKLKPQILDVLVDAQPNLLEMVVFDSEQKMTTYDESSTLKDFGREFIASIDTSNKKLRDEYPNIKEIKCLWSVQECVLDGKSETDADTTQWVESKDFVLKNTTPSLMTSDPQSPTRWLSEMRIEPLSEKAFGKFLLITATIMINPTTNPATGEIIGAEGCIRNVIPAVTPKFERSLTFNHNEEYNTFQIEKDSTNTSYMDGCNIDSEFNKNGQNHPFASPEYPACHDAAKRDHIGVLYRINTPALVKLTMNPKPKELGHISFKLKVPENIESILSSCSKVELFKETDKVTHNSSDVDKQVLKLEKESDTIPAEAKETTYYFSAQLASHTINKGNIKWNWQFNIGPKQDDKEPKQNLMKELQFQPICDVPNVYVVLEEPLAKPWAPRTKGYSPDRDENHNLLSVQERETYSDPDNITPWFQALDFAIVSCKTKGLGGTPEQVKTEIPKVLNTIGDYLFCGHGVSYDHWFGMSFYVEENKFKLNEYIAINSSLYKYDVNYIRKDNSMNDINWDNNKLVNCVDQANAQAHLSRLLGVNTSICQTQPFGYINTCYLVGGIETNNPFFKPGFQRTRTGDLVFNPPSSPIIINDKFNLEIRTLFSMHCYTTYAGCIKNKKYKQLNDTEISLSRAIDSCSGTIDKSCYKLTDILQFYKNAIDSTENTKHNETNQARIHIIYNNYIKFN